MTTKSDRHAPSLSLAILLGCACTAAAAEMPPLKLAQTIPLPAVEGRIDHLAVDAGDLMLFVAALGNNTLEVIDLEAGKRERSIPSLSKPQGVVFLDTIRRLGVTGGGDGTFKVFEASDFRLVKSLRSLDDADNVRYDHGSGDIYVGYGDGALAVFNEPRTEKIGEIKLKGHPESFQLERNGNRIFVNVPEAKQIAVVDREKRAVMATWPMAKFQGNFPMALDEANHRLFVGCRKPPRLVVLDTENGKPVADSLISGDTDDVFFDAKRKRLYVICGEGFVDVVLQVSADAYTLVEKVATATGARTGLFSPELDLLFVAVPHRGNQPAEVRVFKCE
jgi:hypothetical protein